MAWRVKDRITFLLSIDDGTANLHSLALRLLLVGAVHDVGEPPGVSTLFLGLLLELLNSSRIDDAHRVDQVTANRRLASIDVANKDKTGRGARLIHINEILVGHHGDVFDRLRNLCILFLFFLVTLRLRFLDDGFLGLGGLLLTALLGLLLLIETTEATILLL
jgi:hypothetical protein